MEIYGYSSYKVTRRPGLIKNGEIRNKIGEKMFSAKEKNEYFSTIVTWNKSVLCYLLLIHFHKNCHAVSLCSLSLPVRRCATANPWASLNMDTECGKI